MKETPKKNKITEYLNGGIKLSVCDETGSTNEDAKAFLRENDAEKYVFVANKQNEGKGRSGKTFFSPENGIYMTAVLPNVNLFEPGKTTTFAAVCVCRAIEALTDKKPSIKWVNDIYLNGRKICGILCEAVPEKNAAIVGIGLNFRGNIRSLPNELKDKAGYLFGEGENGDRERLIAQIANGLYTSAFDINEYKKRMFLLGNVVVYEKNAKKHEATAIDVDDGGRLVVEENGNITTLDSGEVSVKGKTL